MPAWLKLAQLPWGTIVKQGAAVLAAANELRARTQQPPPSVATQASSDVDVLRKRIEELEQRDRATAELMKQLADQTSALAVAAQATAIKARQAFVLAIVGVTLGVAALLVVWLR
jgi:hypothetical protein